MMKSIQVGLLGLGTVGSGVLKILKNNQAKVSSISKRKITVTKALVRNPQKHMEWGSQVKLVTDFNSILHDPEIEVVIEVIGGLEPAGRYIAALLRSGKSVVTANKDLIATKGPQLVSIANQHNVDFMYEASVAGGVPILNVLSQSFASDEITQIAGIINGTTNFILTQMLDHHVTFQAALKQAQRRGFAETDPTNDVTGRDAAYKMIILTRFAFGANLAMKQIRYQGIENVQALDVQQARELGYTIKLIGLSRKVNNHIFVEVAPTLVQHNSQLATVKNQYNALAVKSMAVGNSFFYGPGAGSLPTGNSIVSDLLAEINDMSMTSEAESFNKYQDHLDAAKDDEVYNSYYLSLCLQQDQPSVLAVQKLLADSRIGFNKLNKVVDHQGTHLIVMTEAINLQQLKAFVKAVQKLQVKVQATYKILE